LASKTGIVRRIREGYLVELQKIAGYTRTTIAASIARSGFPPPHLPGNPK
jgi:hypothetical protein